MNTLKFAIYTKNSSFVVIIVFTIILINTLIMLNIQVSLPCFVDLLEMSWNVDFSKSKQKK